MSFTADSRASESAAPTRRERRRLPQLVGLCVALLWVGAVCVGMERIWRYEGTPGTAGPGPQAWPGSALVTPVAGRPTLIMFVHPRCPCTRASLGELREIVSRSHGNLTASVVFLRPHDVSDAWEQTPTWRAAQAIPGVTVHVDRDGGEAARFGAATSGHTVVYAANGEQAFSGGITAARGHAGDNDGRRAVLALLKGGGTELHAHPTYGCGLHGTEGQGGGA